MKLGRRACFTKGVKRVVLEQSEVDEALDILSHSNCKLMKGALDNAEDMLVKQFEGSPREEWIVDVGIALFNKLATQSFTALTDKLDDKIDSMKENEKSSHSNTGLVKPERNYKPSELDNVIEEAKKMK